MKNMITRILVMCMMGSLAIIAACVEAKKDDLRRLTADFDANKKSIGAGESVIFQDFSENDPDNWSWTFEGGEPHFVSGQNPGSVKYRNEGVYDVTLEISRGTGSNKITDVQHTPDFITVGPPSGACGAHEFSDHDGVQYSVVQIGSQCWLTANHHTRKFRDGTEIPIVQDSAAWAAMTTNQTKTPAVCYGKTAGGSNTASYGWLYNWYAATDPRGLCPVGWHVPSDADWTILTDYLGGILVAGNKMKSTSNWLNGDNGTNSSGFDAIPVGPRDKNGGYEYPFGKRAEYWATTEENGGADAYALFLDQEGVASHDITKKDYGFAIRCVKD